MYVFRIVCIRIPTDTVKTALAMISESTHSTIESTNEALDRRNLERRACSRGNAVGMLLHEGSSGCAWEHCTPVA